MDRCHDLARIPTAAARLHQAHHVPPFFDWMEAKAGKGVPSSSAFPLKKKTPGLPPRPATQAASHPNELRTPNLPNRFLALIPAARSVELAALAEDSVRRTWAEIASKVKGFLDAELNGVCPGWDKHWQAQVNRFPVVDYVVHPWTDTATALTNAANATPPMHGGWDKHPLNLAARWAKEFIPKSEREESYGPHSNAGFAWALHFAATDWKFAACKNARAFAPWQAPGQLDSDGVPKDHLDGKNEVLGGAEHERFWEVLRQKCPQQFKGSQTKCLVRSPPGYHAALSEALANFSLYCARPIIEHEAFGGQLIYAGGDDVLAMTPASTAPDCAQALQLAFRGIHPEDKDADASAAVKRVLNDLFDYSRHTDGFLTLRKSERRDVGRAEHLKPNWPLMVMGPKATVSVGIAIGHIRAPMQETIQAAREAEKAAKGVPNKGALCIRILKRSGEAVGFSARWNDGAVAVWGELSAQIHDLSGRFAYRYTGLVKTLVIVGGSDTGGRYADTWDANLSEAVQAELRHVLRQQGNLKADKAREIAANWCATLIPAFCPRDFLHFWLTWAFVNRLAKPTATNSL